MRRIVQSVLVLGCVAAASTANASQWPLSLQQSQAKTIQPIPSGDLCTGGSAVDDGTYEDGFGVPNIFLGTPDTMVQRLAPSSYPAQLSKVCICWIVGGSGGGHMPFDVVAYADGAIPGNLLGSIATDSGILLGGSTTYIGTSCVPMNVTLQSGGVYVGVRYNHLDEQDFFICGDTSPSTPIAQMFSSINNGTAWHATTQDWSQLHAVGMRAQFTAPGNTCVPSDTTLCLGNGRFKVEASYTSASSGSGPAHDVKLTDDTGYFWFFNQSNVEMVVKVINGCSLNNRFWVYAGGLTDQGVTFTVTDTQKNVAKTYTNTLGQKWVTITDSSALASCP